MNLGRFRIVITPDQLSARIPGSRVLEVPLNWFSKIRNEVDVFHQLYAWLQEQNVCSEEMNNRVYAGDILTKRLFLAEKERLKCNRKFKKLSEEDRFQIFDMNAANYAPRSIFADHIVVGSACFIMPQMEIKDEMKYELLLRKEMRELNVERYRKARSRMSGSTFYEWLLGAQGHDDGIGDVASEIIVDEEYPRKATIFREIERYLENRSIDHHDPIYDRIQEAWIEYITKYPERSEAALWCKVCDLEIKGDKPGILGYSNSHAFFLVHEACKGQLDVEDDDLDSVNAVGIIHSGLTAFRKFATKHPGASFLVPVFEARLRGWGFVDLVGLDESKNTFVYFVQVGLSGPIKIGFASDVAKRVSSLQTACYDTLRVITVIPGGRSLERLLHERFKSHRKSGEWFEPHQDIIDFLANLVGNI